MPWQPLHMADLRKRPKWQQHMDFAVAYLRAAEAQCQGVLTEGPRATYADGAVSLSLAFHGVELFLKASLLKRSPGATFRGKEGHSLEALFSTYCEEFKAPEYRFNLPFRDEPIDYSGMSPGQISRATQEIAQFRKKYPADQIYRYPASVHGELWPALLAFEPNSFLRTVSETLTSIAEIRRHMETEVSA